jgi:uncharacterized protein (DUF433 family)
MTILAINYIEQAPNVMGGKPHIAGRRISVQNIVVLHELHQWGVDAIVEQLDLSPAQVYAALSYYHDHKEEIDLSVQSADDYPREVGVSFSELKDKIEREMKE